MMALTIVIQINDNGRSSIAHALDERMTHVKISSGKCLRIEYEAEERVNTVMSRLDRHYGRR